MLEALNEAYVEAQKYVQGYFEQTDKATNATNGLAGALTTVTTTTKDKKVYDAGTLGYYEQQLKAANEALNNAASKEAYDAAMQIVNTYRREIEKIKGEGMTGTMSPVTANTDISGITGLAGAAANIDTTAVVKAGEAEDERREKMARTLELMKEINDFQQGMMLEGVNSLAGAFNSLGGAIGGVAGNIVSLIGTMAQQIAQGVVTIVNLKMQAAAYADEARKAGQAAAAKAMEAHAWIPFVGIAMGVGMVASMIAAIKSVPEFAEGAYADRPTLGIFGEKGPELVVPEKKLDEAFERNAGKMGMGGVVRFEIDGRSLVGVLEAENNRNNWRP